MNKLLISIGLVLVAMSSGAFGEESILFPLLMPEVQPTKADSYLCTAFKMPSHEHRFIVEYLPNATMETAHHILIYGCSMPGYYERDTPRTVWNCGEMANRAGGPDIYPKGPICKGSSQIIFGWAMDAPALKLPEGVGFKVGHGTDINYLVLQVHYAHVHRFVHGDLDHSGITLRMLPQETNEINKLAGVYLMATDGYIKPHQTEHFEAACQIQEPLVIHPFAFRTHTHKLGKVVAGYRVDGETGEWQLIGKRNPQLPQMFYPVSDDTMTIKQGDVMASRCTMHNNQTHTVRIGMTGEDEMCNFYMMYYVNRMDRILDDKVCFTMGPPNFYWRYNLQVPRNIHEEASRL